MERVEGSLIPQPQPANVSRRVTVRELTEDEIDARRVICGRLFYAWPNANPANPEATLDEYVNATRGYPIEKLNDLIQWTIDAGGEFIPPAGQVVRRAATHYYTSIKPPRHTPWTSREEQTKTKVGNAVRRMSLASRSVYPIGVGPEATAARNEIMARDPAIAPLVDGIVKKIGDGE